MKINLDEIVPVYKYAAICGTVLEAKDMQELHLSSLLHRDICVKCNSYPKATPWCN